MGIVTLLTDWGQRSPQLASIKGNLLHELPETRFIDISHIIPAFDLVQGSYIFQNAYRNFPAGTVHYIGMDSTLDDAEASASKDYIIIKKDDHFFIGADSGFFSLVFEEKPEDMVRISIPRQTYKYHFNVDIIRYICALLSDGDIYDLGDKASDYMERELFKPIFENNKTIRGAIIHVDDFGNVITNIKKPFFEKVGAGRAFSIALRKSEYHIDRICNWYDEVDTDDILAIFNSSDHMEIALNQGNASTLLGMHVDDKIRIDFSE